jgi:3-keto-disaccharide hydrolase
MTMALRWVGAAAVMAAGVCFARPVSAVEKAADESAGKAKADEGFKSIFDGKTLDGWKANENPESWTVVDGTIMGKGPRSHLFYMPEEFTDCEFKADVKLQKGGNSGMYFRTAFGPGFPKGYEAQVNNSGRDPVKTGSLYNFAPFKKQLIADDTWWNQHIIVQGNHIVIKVNDKVVVDFVDDKSTFKKGHLALQEHDPGTVVQYKNLMVKPLKAAK